MLFLMLCHEFGHYIIAYRLKWNPKLTIIKFMKLPAFAVVTRNIHLDIKSNNEFFNWYKKLTAFYSCSILTSILGTLFILQLELITVDMALIFCLMWSMYGVWEVTTPKFEGYDALQ